MMERMRKTLRILLLLLCCISAVVLARRILDSIGGGESYNDALLLAFGNTETAASEETEAAGEETETMPEERWVPAPIEDDAHVKELESLDLDALREVNPDVIGWIQIPGTKIDYPIMQGEDNAYYLEHTWDGKALSVGSIFMECRNNGDFTDYNTILYGHNRNDGSMFANLKRYSTDWYWQQHPYVYVVTDSGVLRYEVFSSYKAAVDGTAYGLSFQQQETKIHFLEEAIKNSQAYNGIKPEITDRILTLSTCSGGGYSHRWVVHARLRMVKETDRSGNADAGT